MLSHGVTAYLCRVLLVSQPPFSTPDYVCSRTSEDDDGRGSESFTGDALPRIRFMWLILTMLDGIAIRLGFGPNGLSRVPASFLSTFSPLLWLDRDWL